MPTNKQNSQSGRRAVLNDSIANTCEVLGPYRGNEPGFYNAHPVIFDRESAAPHQEISFIFGALTPDKGTLGTWFSDSDEHGKVRLVIYGDPTTGMPSSWTLLEWVGSGKKQPNTNIEIYEWRHVPNAKAALSKKGFNECYFGFMGGAKAGKAVPQ